MAIQRTAPTLSTADVLDRVLDKGLVIDAEIHIAVAGIELVTVNALVKIASFETWDRYTATERQRRRRLPARAPAPRPAPETEAHRARLRCEDGCTFERSAWTMLVRDGRLAHQRCAVKPGVRCAVTVV
jgi:gas vesicle structural protein